MPSVSAVERLLPWAVRAVWIAVLVTGGPVIDGDIARYCALIGWTVGVGAMAVPAVTSLTATRLVVPLAPVAALIALTTDNEPVDLLLFLFSGVLATVMIMSPAFGRVFVQASAYGAEDRHLLRAPAAYALASAAAWAMWAAALIATPLLFDDRRWTLGALSAVLAVAGAVAGWPRWHRLSRRWFVVVPVGIVIHDQLVLAETLMLRRQELARIRLAHADTEAADLTGPASGHALEISTTDSTTAILAATPKQPNGTAIHLRSCLVAPTRPGRALQAAAERRLPVG